MSERARKAIGYSIATMIIVVAISVGAYSCILPSSDTTLCPGNLRCPPGSRCLEGMNICILETCGNGVPDDGEACDDRNNISGDGCSADCLSDETCGNGYVDTAAGEICDDGEDNSEDGCRPDCLSDARDCGNGKLDAGEECDTAIPVGEDGACPTVCIASDSCIAAELLNEGTCRAFCQITHLGINPDVSDGCCPPGANAAVDDPSYDPDCEPECGNGIKEPGEECDDGNDDNSDSCVEGCKKAICGDGYLWIDEELCDDGDENSVDGCRDDCQFDERWCGNGVIDPGEQCDDGNENTDDICPSGPPIRDEEGKVKLKTCQWAFCGDGFVWKDIEACDPEDPTAADNAKCSEDCRSDLTCGNGIIDPGEQCDAGEYNPETGLGNHDNNFCTSDCNLSWCGDGLVWHGVEQCDPSCNDDVCGGTCPIGQLCTLWCACTT